MSAGKRSYLFVIFILLAYLPVLLAHHTVDPDASIILKNLSDAGGPLTYFRNLFQLETVDFQPLRDFTLSFDLWIFHHLDINTFILQNLLWWLGSLFIIGKILSLLFPELNQFARNIILSCFGVYPLFSFVVSWGMNRKHLMAFFFIMFASYWLLKKLDRLPRKDFIFISFLYVLSVLSQPIHILWPLWAFMMMKGKRNGLFFPITLLTLLASLTTINWIYYRYSPVYNFFYAEKTSDLFNIPDKLLATGHYLFQIAFPYLLSFKYDLSHWDVLAGLLVFILFALFFLKQKKNIREYLPWIVLAFLPILIVLNDPHVLADSYLLLPSACALIILLKAIQISGKKIRPAFLFVPLIIWTAIAYHENEAWTSRRELASRSFERRPSCSSATNYVMVSYDLYQRAPDGMKYVEGNNCLKVMQVTPQTYRTMTVLFARHYFHADEIPMNVRLERLKDLADKHYLAHFAYIGLLIKNGMNDEARREAMTLKDRWEKFNLTSDYDEITARYVHGYCVKEKIQDCLEITSLFVKPTKTPYL